MHETNTNSTPTHPRSPGSPWSIPEAAKFLTISKRHLYRLIDANKVRSLRIGRRRLIPAAEVERIAKQGC